MADERSDAVTRTGDGAGAQVGDRTPADRPRIHSLDQFRGYTVAGMFLVNFLGHFDRVPGVLKHNDIYFSYADSILPGFLFAAGMSYRLTWLRRRASQPALRAASRYVRRSMLLVLISWILFGAGGGFESFRQMTSGNLREYVAALLKARLWEVLAIIGVTQVMALPLIGRSVKVRTAAIVSMLAVHTMLSASFNVAFVLGQPNWMDAYWGAAGVRAWDGGVFGLLGWTAVLLSGSLAFDLVAAAERVNVVRRLALAGVGVFALGYLLSGLSLSFEGAPRIGPNVHVAASPVVPDAWRGSGPRTWLPLAELPFVATPPPAQRPWNYWMASKRLVSLPFVLLGIGFSLIAYALFVQLVDRSGRSAEVLRILGQNALMAYAVHYLILQSMSPLMPADGPPLFIVGELLVFALLAVGAVYYFDREGLRLRL